MNANINRKSFAEAAATLKNDDPNEVVVYDAETNEFSVSPKVYADELGEQIVMNGDTGYWNDPDYGMSDDEFEKSMVEFYMSDAFDFSEIELAIEKENKMCGKTFYEVDWDNGQVDVFADIEDAENDWKNSNTSDDPEYWENMVEEGFETDDPTPSGAFCIWSNAAIKKQNE